MRIVVTGGAGFIGNCLVRQLLALPDQPEVVVLDALTYAGHLSTLDDVLGRVTFHRGDIRDGAAVEEALRGADAVMHLAAETHVDRSISDDRPFVETNVTGTQVLLSAARRAGVSRFVHVSTDEVYGALGPTGAFTESSPLAPRSPYAATKAASDLLALAYHETYGLPVVVTRCGNNYGPYQFPEKLIPLTVIRALRGEPIPVYGAGKNVRDWIHVEDHCRGLIAALRRGRPGAVYNFGASGECTNLDLVLRILDIVGADRSLVRFVPDRPGHDFRYAIDSTRARTELEWQPGWDQAAGLEATVRWYREHREWWEPLLAGDYARYIQTQYGALSSFGANA